MRAMTEPGVTVSPGETSSSAIVPSAVAGTSSATLSVSISAIVSSLETLSPTFFRNSPSVPSVTLSPIGGTVTSVRSPPPEGALASCLGASSFGCSALSDFASAGALSSLAGASPLPLPRRPSTAPISTVSPSLATISLSVPSAVAATSTETLSVSSSTRTSSLETLSPAFLSHWPTVASVTLSPS